MEIAYVYSAGVKIKTEDCRIICDPWWSPAYDGSWVQWPRWANSLDEAIEIYGEADLIYCSHLHPDHYDPEFLRAYLAKYPKTRVLIADMEVPLLQRKLESRGIHPIVGLHHHGDTWLTPIPNRANTFNIDSALVVKHGDLTVANLNDNPYDQKQIDAIKFYTADHPTVALLPFVGAGPWPQCYHFDDIADQLRAVEAKKRKYLDLFKRYCEALQPKIAVPFAGQYWLHGEQIDLNPLRGMADATECYAFYPGVWVPKDGGQAMLDCAYISTEDWITSQRHMPYDWPVVRKELDLLHVLNSPFPHDPQHYRALAYRYEREIQVPVERLPLLKLLQSATRNCYSQFKERPNLYICIKTQLLTWWIIDTQSSTVVETSGPIEMQQPRVEVFIDARYLFGMLTRLYNANSVRIGSLCRFKVVPNVYDKELDDLFGEYWDSLRV